MKQENLVIIGSGPAGLTAAIYSARANLEPLVFAGVEWGGQLMTTTLVENYPGFAEGIMGPELMQNMVRQAERYGARIIYDNVDNIRLKTSMTELNKVYAGGKEYETRSLIIATGSYARRLNIPGEKEFWGRGVSTCATCDAAFYRNKTVAVIGGGDSAMEESQFLTRFADKVYIVHRKDTFRASDIMQKRTRENPKIEIIWDTEVLEVIGDKKVTGLKLLNNKTQSNSQLEVDGMFLAIGHDPNSTLFQGQLDLDEKGYIKVASGKTLTSVDGVFVCGDVHDSHYEQAITAAGMGCMAALDAQGYLV